MEYYTKRGDYSKNEALVQKFIYKEIWDGTLPGYQAVLHPGVSRVKNENRVRDVLRPVRERIHMARRYRDVMYKLGWGGLVFMDPWFRREWAASAITPSTKWNDITNAMQDGRSWFHDEVRRIFKDEPAELISTLTGTSTDNQS